MKQLLDLSTEYIIDTRFLANQVKDENTGYYRNDWVDDKKDKARGRQNVDSIVMLVQILTPDGYSSLGYNKVYISKDDILKLADRIKEIEAITGIATPYEDLPF
jgi:hypothetical protein